jgi:hypothetical protein
MDYLLADIVWRPLIGARWIWVISAAHLLASWLCLQAGRKERFKPDGRRDSIAPKFWLVLSVFMFVLFLNKFLDLQSLLTLSLRRSARVEGWYKNRRSLQYVFVVVSAAMGTTCLAASLYLLRSRWRQCGLACFAAVFLLTLVVIRSASYHPIDELIYGMPYVGNRANAGLELAGALLVCLGARLASRQTVMGKGFKR